METKGRLRKKKQNAKNAVEEWKKEKKQDTEGHNKKQGKELGPRVLCLKRGEPSQKK